VSWGGGSGRMIMTKIMMINKKQQHTNHPTSILYWLLA
jgi:hypothetical protein